jgi:hypothetical protein
MTVLKEYLEKTESGETLEFDEFGEAVELGLTPGRHRLAYNTMKSHVDNISDVDGMEGINLMRARDFAEENELDASPFQEMLESYFDNSNVSDKFKNHMAGELPSSMSIADVRNGLYRINNFFDFDVYHKQPELRDERIEVEEADYLRAVDENIDWV